MPIWLIHSSIVRHWWVDGPSSVDCSRFLREHLAKGVSQCIASDLLPFLALRDVAAYLHFPNLSEAISSAALSDIVATLGRLERNRNFDYVSWQEPDVRAEAFKIATEYGVPLEDAVDVAIAEAYNVPLLVAHDDQLADLIRLSELRLSFRVEHIRNVVQRILGS